ncbi:MAG: hypothetical protein HC834_01155, partial [Rhodospirillales bacterium]|nr:hypothetical protein [Rhodospirillales bacterium]
GANGFCWPRTWLEHQVRKLNVSIHLGVEVNLAQVMDERPEAVIVAVGGKPGAMPWPASDNGTRVITPRQAMNGHLPATPGKAVIIDRIGDPVGMGVAERLAEEGWRVEVVTSDMFVGQRLTASLELTPWNQRAAAKGIAFRPQIKVGKLANRQLVGNDAFDRREIVIDDVDLVVPVVHEVPDEALYFALKQAGQRVFRAGDCVAPRYMSQAILEGYRAGREV